MYLHDYNFDRSCYRKPKTRIIIKCEENVLHARPYIAGGARGAVAPLEIFKVKFFYCTMYITFDFSEVMEIFNLTSNLHMRNSII